MDEVTFSKGAYVVGSIIRDKLVQTDCVAREHPMPRMPLSHLAPCAMQGEQWWRLRCQVLDSAEQPVNASATRSAACPPGQQGPRQGTPMISCKGQE